MKEGSVINMARKKSVYPRLTMKQARELAIMQFDTAKGLRKYEPYQNWYEMNLGLLHIEIKSSRSEPGLLEIDIRMGVETDEIVRYFHPDTLAEDYDAESRYHQQRRMDHFHDWVDSNGPDHCKQEIDRVWNRV